MHDLTAESVATMITTRNSGASYKNRVELQSSCLALALANLLIPTTLNGACLINDGKVNQTKLKENLSSAIIDVYLSRVDGAPCASNEIHLFHGTESATCRNENNLVKVFLKGSKKAKEELQTDHPEMYRRISEIFDLQQRHLYPGVLIKYVSYLGHQFCKGCC